SANSCYFHLLSGGFFLLLPLPVLWLYSIVIYARDRIIFCTGVHSLLSGFSFYTSKSSHLLARCLGANCFLC
ncbi:hypothetical protein C7212DRAFT_308242, partial [Tuber magnatum]